jgi:hypothetical protein
MLEAHQTISFFTNSLVPAYATVNTGRNKPLNPNSNYVLSFTTVSNVAFDICGFRMTQCKYELFPQHYPFDLCNGEVLHSL